MDIKAFPALIVGVVVALVLAGAVLPVFAETTSATDTFKNEGYFRMSEVSATDDDVIITWDYTKPYTFNINGTDFNLPTGTTGGNNAYPYTIMAQDGWGVRVSVSAGDKVDLNLYGSGTNAGLLWYATVTDSDTATITLSNGTASFVRNTGTPVTQTYTKVYIPDNDGDYTLKKKDTNAYLNKDSLIYSTGRTSTLFGSNNFAINCNLTGNIEDGETVNVIAPSGFTPSNAVVNATEVNNYLDLYSFSSVTFDITQDSTDITVNAVYSQVIVPHEVTAEQAVHPDGPLTVMLNVLPLLAIAGLVTGAVVWFINRKG